MKMRSRHGFRGAGLLACAGAMLASALPAWAQQNALREERGTFLSGGQKIGVEMFRPTQAEHLPAIVVLHGSRGIEFGNAYIRQLASLLAANGFATFLVHYFDSTETDYANDAAIHKNFKMWLETINDAVSFVAKQPDIDRDKIGCFGFSLGGYFALAQAARDPRIQAVVELAGGVDSSYVNQFQRMPPTLILHGDDDHRVPVSNAYEIERLAKKFGAPYEMKIYNGESHFFSQTAILDSVVRGLGFFEKYLR